MLLGRPLIGWTIEAFARCGDVDDIVIATSDPDVERMREIAEEYGGGKVVAVVAGGDDRQTSVRLGLDAAPEDAHRIIVHDAARPCVTPTIVSRVLKATLMAGGGATAVIPIADSLVQGQWSTTPAFPDGYGRVVGMEPFLERSGLYAIQTPQAFVARHFRFAHKAAAEAGFQATDDASVYHRHGLPVYFAMGSSDNLKVTHPDDLAIAEAILMQRQGMPAAPSVSRPLTEAPYRVGMGYDVHPFAEGRPLFLGGVHFADAECGLKGHSDGDVLLHAVCDALLGAASLGDIGKLFPDTDPANKNRRSVDFLAEVGRRILEAGWRVGNIDVMVLAETPRIAPRSEEIKQFIGDVLGIPVDAVSIKATTNEGLGFIGRGEGIAVQATALVVRR